ncbi:MAG: hypothetical protein ACE5IY_08965, partial [bacterium]
DLAEEFEAQIHLIHVFEMPFHYPQPSSWQRLLKELERSRDSKLRGLACNHLRTRHPAVEVFS